MTDRSPAGVSRETPTVEVKGVTTNQGRKAVLHDISLTLPVGGFAALVGPNGSGKSTLLRTLTGELRPTRGSVHICGEAVAPGNARILSQRMAYVPQNNPMTFPFTVEELVSLGGTGRDAIERALSAMELTGFRMRSVLSLSGGERQRAALARALAQETPVLLLDEPITHLDPRHQIGVLRAAQEAVREGRTVLAVLHDLSLAAAFADTILFLHDGRLIAHGSPAEALTQENLRLAYGVPFTFAVQPSSEHPTITFPH